MTVCTRESGCVLACVFLLPLASYNKENWINFPRTSAWEGVELGKRLEWPEGHETNTSALDMQQLVKPCLADYLIETPKDGVGCILLPPCCREGNHIRKAEYLTQDHKTSMCWRDLNSGLGEHCSHTVSLKLGWDVKVQGFYRDQESLDKVI